MSATRQRLVIYGAQGKIRGIIENRVLRKEIRGRVHLLRKPPAIALDARMYDRYRPYFDEIEITDATQARSTAWQRATLTGVASR